MMDVKLRKKVTPTNLGLRKLINLIEIKLLEIPIWTNYKIFENFRKFLGVFLIRGLSLLHTPGVPPSRPRDAFIRNFEPGETVR